MNDSSLLPGLLSFRGMNRRSFFIRAATGAGAGVVAQASCPTARGQAGGGKIPEPVNRPHLPAHLRDRLGCEVHVRDWLPPSLRADVSNQINQVDLQPYIQAAFDEAPLGCDLIFDGRDWRVDRPLTLSRQMNLVGRGARIIGEFGANCDDNLINVRVRESTFGGGDIRRMKIEGLDLYFSSGGLSALHVENEAPMASQLMMLIERCGIAGPDTGLGAAIKFQGVVTQAHTIRNCQIDNTVHLSGCADSVQIEQNLIAGTKVGVLCDLAQGAFRTGIRRNTIVSRDNAITVLNGAEIDIIENQIEQPVQNKSEVSAHILISPNSYGVQRLRIIGNNFGGGPKVCVPIHCAGGIGGVDDLFFDQNTFATGSSGYDVILSDDLVRWARFGPNNTFRYDRHGVRVNTANGHRVYAINGNDAAENTIDPGLMVLDRGLGTMGLRKPADALGLTNGWRGSPAFTFTKGLDGLLIFTGHLTPGSRQKGSAVGRLPPGFRPEEDVLITATTDASPKPALFTVTPNGELTVAFVEEGAKRVWLQSLKVRQRTTYDPGV